MNRTHQTRGLLLACVGVLLLTVAAVGADRLQLLSQVRVVLHDVLSPGRLVAAAIAGAEASHSNADSKAELTALEQQVQSTEQQIRQLLIENSQLNNRLRQLKVSKGHSGRHAPLAGFELISARVLSYGGMPSGVRQAMIDAGRAHGLMRSELVLDAQGLLLDQGQDGGVGAGQAVLAGSVVLGRIERTGRWVSQLLPVTDESYSARVRLVRHSSRGTHLGAEGMLEGTGEGCRIIGIPDTASVAVGDEVFSADINGVAGPRLYYGTVSVAQFESAGEWSIEVQPAGHLSDIEQVAVVVPQLNAARTALASQQTISEERQ